MPMAPLDLSQFRGMKLDRRAIVALEMHVVGYLKACGVPEPRFVIVQRDSDLAVIEPEALPTYQTDRWKVVMVSGAIRRLYVEGDPDTT